LHVQLHGRIDDLAGYLVYGSSHLFSSLRLRVKTSPFAVHGGSF
jgi:hypothetical protein